MRFAHQKRGGSMQPRHLLYFLAIVILILAMAALATGTTEFQSGGSLDSGVVSTPTIPAVAPQVQPAQTAIAPSSQGNNGGSSTCQSWKFGTLQIGEMIPEGDHFQKCVGPNRWECVPQEKCK